MRSLDPQISQKLTRSTKNVCRFPPVRLGRCGLQIHLRQDLFAGTTFVRQHHPPILCGRGVQVQACRYGGRRGVHSRWSCEVLVLCSRRIGEPVGVWRQCTTHACEACRRWRPGMPSSAFLSNRSPLHERINVLTRYCVCVCACVRACVRVFSSFVRVRVRDCLPVSSREFRTSNILEIFLAG